EVPTAEEAGLPGYETYNWHAVFVPAAVPRGVVTRLEAAAVAAVANPAIRQRLVENGVDPRGDGAAVLEAFWDQQLALWVPLIRASGCGIGCAPGFQNPRSRTGIDRSRSVSGVLGAEAAGDDSTRVPGSGTSRIP
ncbi:MAG TPA: tripartite tricarboxylate transporter substrate-binding protein, partial [Verrucomicrobiota bacterium]|nr:tripartite tricarboxylate transporter substrate-binding protein [Verrucomicrobiota bacterium]